MRAGTIVARRPMIVGLGNPGAEYESTRHNIGFLIVDLIAREAGAQIKRKDCRALVGRAEIEGVGCDLVKPQTYMNLSGESVSCLFAKQAQGSDTGSLIVISDDLALPFGRIRIRPRGSAGGHNGLKSIISAMKTDEFIRLRVGILPEHPIGDTKNFVLSEFSKQERANLDEVLKRGADALRTIVKDGVDRAMAEFN
jgi:PTH1 family peptidyl-tRNA hydrolase